SRTPSGNPEETPSWRSAPMPEGRRLKRKLKKEPGGLHASALTIQPEWLSLILAGKKTWEIRKQQCLHRGDVALMASGTSQIWGMVEIVSSSRTSWEDLLASRELHRVPEEKLAAYCSQETGGMVWALQNPRILEQPLACARKGSSINWVKIDDTTMELLNESILRVPDLECRKTAKTLCRQMRQVAEERLRTVRNEYHKARLAGRAEEQTTRESNSNSNSNSSSSNNNNSSSNNNDNNSNSNNNISSNNNDNNSNSNTTNNLSSLSPHHSELVGSRAAANNNQQQPTPTTTTRANSNQQLQQPTTTQQQQPTTTTQRQQPTTTIRPPPPTAALEPSSSWCFRTHEEMPMDPEAFAGCRVLARLKRHAEKFQARPDQRTVLSRYAANVKEQSIPDTIMQVSGWLIFAPAGPCQAPTARGWDEEQPLPPKPARLLLQLLRRHISDASEVLAGPVTLSRALHWVLELLERRGAGEGKCGCKAHQKLLRLVEEMRES
ncbi:unnamed protein product, partial [Polarella glacialis]